MSPDRRRSSNRRVFQSLLDLMSGMGSRRLGDGTSQASWREACVTGVVFKAQADACQEALACGSINAQEPRGV